MHESIARNRATWNAMAHHWVGPGERSWATDEITWGVPLADGCCDLVVSEYGAALWADPRRWLPEAARLLRPGGELVFLTGSVLHTLCAPDEGHAGPELVRAHRDLYAVDYPDDESLEYHVGHGEMVRLLRSSGFEILDLVELHAPDGAADSRLLSGDSEFLHVPASWAHRWPVEEIWHARRP